MPRPRTLLLALVVAAVVAVAVALVVRSRARDASLLEGVPASSFVVATLDVEALRASPASSWAHEGAAALARLMRASEICGIDVPARTHEIAFSMPGESRDGAFGFAFRIDVSQAELARCTTGESSAASGISVTPRGSFYLVDMGQGPVEGRPRLAYRPGGPLLLSEGVWLEEMMAAAEGRSPSAAAGDHARLRTLVEGKGSDRAGFVATALLPRSLRDRLREEMRVELGAAFVGDGRTATAESMLAVESAAFGVSFGSASRDAELRGVLVCDSEAASGVVATFLEKQRLGFAQDLRLRLLGLGRLVSSFTVQAKGREVHIGARLPAADLRDLGRRVASLGGRGSAAIAPRSQPPGAAEDEVVRPRPTDAGAGAVPRLP